MLADNSITYIRIFDKSSGNILYNGKVKFDKDALVKADSPTNEVIKYNNIKQCKID